MTILVKALLTGDSSFTILRSSYCMFVTPMRPMLVRDGVFD